MTEMSLGNRLNFSGTSKQIILPNQVILEVGPNQLLVFAPEFSEPGWIGWAERLNQLDHRADRAFEKRNVMFQTQGRNKHAVAIELNVLNFCAEPLANKSEVPPLRRRPNTGRRWPHGF